MIQINYSPSSLEDFKAAIEFLKGNEMLKANVTRSRGSNVERYLKETGGKRFKMSAEERARVEKGEIDEDGIAAERLTAMGVVTADKLPEDDGGETY